MFVFGFDGRGLQRARIHLRQIVQLHVFDFTWCLGSAASSGDFGALFSHTNKSHTESETIMMTLSAYPARYLFVSATSLFSAGSSSSSANASAGGAVAEHSHGPVVGFVDGLLQFACHGGGDGRASGQVAADHAVPLPTGANTPGPRRNTPPFGYPDNLQSNGCCTFN